jgi:hypothetical protein
LTGILFCIRNADTVMAESKTQGATAPTNGLIALPSGKLSVGIATASTNTSSNIPDAYPSGGGYSSPIIVNALNANQDGSYAVYKKDISGTDWTPTGFTNSTSIGWVLGTLIAYTA